VHRWSPLSSALLSLGCSEGRLVKFLVLLLFDSEDVTLDVLQIVSSTEVVVSFFDPGHQVFGASRTLYVLCAEEGF
jgi:hypothetical protein